MVEETPYWSHILFPIEDDLGRCGMFLADFAMSDLIQASDFFTTIYRVGNMHWISLQNIMVINQKPHSFVDENGFVNGNSLDLTCGLR